MMQAPCLPALLWPAKEASGHHASRVHGMRSGAGEGAYEAYEGSVPSAAFSAQRGSRPGHLPCRQQRGTCRRYSRSMSWWGWVRRAYMLPRLSNACRRVCMRVGVLCAACHARVMHGQPTCSSSGSSDTRACGRAPYFAQLGGGLEALHLIDKKKSREAYLREHHGWPYAKRRRPSGPSTWGWHSALYFT